MDVARDETSAPRLLAALAVCAGLCGLMPSRAEAQCQIVAAPSLFDPPPGGVSPPTLRTMPNRVVVGGPAGARQVVVRYNYGFLVYDLASPAAPAMAQKMDLRSAQGGGYPVSGDGQSRAGMVSLSSDGARALVPWGDTGLFGTIVLSPTPFSGGGEYLPRGTSTKMTAALKTAGRYLAFSWNSANVLWVADVTNVQRGVPADESNPNQIGSWQYVGPTLGTGSPSTILKAVEGDSRAFLVAASNDTVTVIDVSAPGPAGPGIASGFSYRTFSLSELGLSSGKIWSLSAALHPTDGGLYLLVEAGQLSGGVYLSTGVTLTRVEPPASAGGAFGPAEPKGDHLPEAAVRKAQPGSLLLSFDTELVAVYFEGADADGALHLNVRSSSEFSQNRAAGLTFASPTQFEALDGFRSSGGTFHVYMGHLTVGTYAASVSCVSAGTDASTPGPDAASAGPDAASAGLDAASAGLDAASAGLDASSCAHGATCSVGDCQTGIVDCSSGSPVCGSLVDRPEGTACPGGSCRSGVCVLCEAGAICASADGCQTGTIECPGGTAECQHLSPVADGTSCGAGKVCSQGACLVCNEGGACSSVDGCQTGTVSCATGQPACGDLEAVADGTSCGAGECQAGVCSSCVTGEDCESASGCQEGKIDCAGGVASCVGMEDKTNGTPCPGGVCHAGVCFACGQGETCLSQDGCMQGTLECATGASVCSHLGILPDGAPCPGGRCRNGRCASATTTDAGSIGPGPADAAATGRDAAGEAVAARDASGPVGSAPPTGCGCSTSTAPWGLACVLLAFARRRRR